MNAKASPWDNWIALAIGICALTSACILGVRAASRHSHNSVTWHHAPKPKNCDWWYAPIGNKGCVETIDYWKLSDGEIEFPLHWTYDNTGDLDKLEGSSLSDDNSANKWGQPVTDIYTKWERR